MNKERVFWAVWAAVILGGIVFYFAVITDRRQTTQQKMDERDRYAARFVPSARVARASEIKKLVEEIRNAGKPNPPSAAPEMVQIDHRLWEHYPLALPKSLEFITNCNRYSAEARKKRAADLVVERAKCVELFKGLEFKVALADFQPPPPAGGHIAVFRQWAEEEDKRIDDDFDKSLNPKFQPGGSSRLSRCLPNFTTGAVKWLEDGKLSGQITDADRPVILERLFLRRKILMAAARAKGVTEYEDMKPQRDGQLVSAGMKPQPRSLEYVSRLTFLDYRPAAGTPGAAGGARMPYVPQPIAIQARCHLAVVPGLLRELQDMGGAGPDKRFAFWVERLYVSRPQGVPGPAVSKASHYDEWPVEVFVLGVVPKFKPELDPAP